MDHALEGPAFARAYASLTPARQADFARASLADVTVALGNATAAQRRCAELADERAGDLAAIDPAAAAIGQWSASIEALGRVLHAMLRAALRAAHGTAPRLRQPGTLWAPLRRWWCRTRSARGPPAGEDDEPPAAPPPGPPEAAT